jgi:hypothetical protein
VGRNQVTAFSLQRAKDVEILQVTLIFCSLDHPTPVRTVVLEEESSGGFRQTSSCARQVHKGIPQFGSTEPASQSGKTPVSPERYELHGVLCGNASQFQGDERDVVFISLVDTAERGSLSLRDQELFKQLFNVAASRAWRNPH